MSSPIILLAENQEWALYQVKSFTNDMVYGVDIDKDEKTVSCSCPHFQYRLQTEKWGGAKLEDTSHHCKHIKEVLNEGGSSISQGA